LIPDNRTYYARRCTASSSYNPKGNDRMSDVPATIQELGDKIANLKISEAVLLKEYLKEKYKIEPAAGGAVMMAAAPGVAAGAAEEAPTVQTEFDVMLDGLTDATKKIGVIKVVRELTNCGLAEGKTLVESAPKPVKEKVSKDEAETIKKKLEEAGAKVSIK
jgi:large subunit ribosomal protein L7/L12